MTNSKITAGALRRQSERIKALWRPEISSGPFRTDALLPLGDGLFVAVKE